MKKESLREKFMPSNQSLFEMGELSVKEVTESSIQPPDSKAEKVYERWVQALLRHICRCKLGLGKGFTAT